MAQRTNLELPPSGLIVAGAGSGERLGREGPKAFIELAGEALLVRSVRPFLAIDCIAEIVAVVPPGSEERAAGLFESAGLADRITAVVPGGAIRQESVARGLAALTGRAELVLIHDAARPLVTPELIGRVLAAAAEHGAAVPGIRPIDTVKQTDERGVVTGTPDRDRLRAIQTPQAFRRELIDEAYAAAAVEGSVATDDAALIERLGRDVHVVQGDRGNLKITVMDDLAFCERLLRGASRTTGKGARQ